MRSSARSFSRRWKRRLRRRILGSARSTTKRWLDEIGIVDSYRPEIGPPRTEWLALDEHERLLLVERYHERARIELPDARLHAVMHTIVETQLAEPVPEVVAVMERLRREGLHRHDALHAIASVLAPHLVALLNSPSRAGDPHAPYFAGLRELTAARWRATGSQL